jgi:TrmH family RNA methyltransferase
LSDQSQRQLRDRFRIVLVHPRKAGNVGAASRAVANMGLPAVTVVDGGRLGGREKLVAHRWAKAWAASAYDQLARVEVVPDLTSALEGCVLAVGLSARRRGSREPAPIPVPEAIPCWLEYARRGPVALLFGPEDRGLSADELKGCGMVARIPTGDEHPVLNLASAVLLVGYELLRTTSGEAPAAPATTTLATLQDLDRLLRLGQDVLQRAGFLQRQGAEEHGPLGALLHRHELLESEYRFLMGALQQLGKALPRDT